MDRNSIIGFLLIGLILIGYSIYFSPSEAEIAQQKIQRDSIALVEEQQAKATAETIDRSEETNVDSVESIDSLSTVSDSAKASVNKEKFGIFAPSAEPIDKHYTIENEFIKLTIAAKGGRLAQVQLKNYQTSDSLPLLLFDEKTSSFDVNFYSENRFIHSNELYFEGTKDSVFASGEKAESLRFKLKTNDPKKFVEYVYTITPNSYLVDFKVNYVGLSEVVQANAGAVSLAWSIQAPLKEKSRKNEIAASTIYFKYNDEKVDYLSPTNYEKVDLDANIEWISFKQQYFSAALLAENGFKKANSDYETKELTNENYTKEMSTNLTIDLDEKGTAAMQFYFGPNHYQTLKNVGHDFEDQIDLGWTVFSWVNKFLVIPVFNFLDNYHLNYGLIILLLTIFIKMLLFPITYKNYLSSARMKVLKPEMDELNEKYKDEDAVKKQQAVMTLYKQAGVNPLAGCIPMLLQLPILYAMFRFFPASIELRQESFLWAKDLSTYDSILDLGFDIPFYGDHVSLFTILMAISTFLYSKYNMQATMQSGPQAQQMKIIMYFMPVMLLGVFNGSSAGLSFYYFAANMISVLQQWVIKKFFINEEAIHRQIQENKKKPAATKKSGFQKRLEDMAKQSGKQLPKPKK